MKRKPGTHILVEMYGCDEKKIDDIFFVKKVFRKAIKESGLKSLKSVFYKFNPQGITGVALLTSSHISIHTWPEYRVLFLDIFACDERKKAIKAMEVFLKEFQPKRYKKKILSRGYIYQR